MPVIKKEVFAQSKWLQNPNTQASWHDVPCMESGLFLVRVPRICSVRIWKQQDVYLMMKGPGWDALKWPSRECNVIYKDVCEQRDSTCSSIPCLTKASMAATLQAQMMKGWESCMIPVSGSREVNETFLCSEYYDRQPSPVATSHPSIVWCHFRPWCPVHSSIAFMLNATSDHWSTPGLS